MRRGFSYNFIRYFGPWLRILSLFTENLDTAKLGRPRGPKNLLHLRRRRNNHIWSAFSVLYVSHPFVRYRPDQVSVLVPGFIRRRAPPMCWAHRSGIIEPSLSFISPSPLGPTSWHSYRGGYHPLN